MAKSLLSVANIVATATPLAWAQAYHAGGLTAVVAVRHKEEAAETVASLHIVGKDILNTFESEYFTLENKSLTSIHKAVEATYKKSADTHDISLIVAASVQNALYVFLAGTGEIFLLRKGKLGSLLAQHIQEDATDVQAASGFLEDGDMVVLATTPFTEIVSHASLLSALTDNTAEGAGEILSPKIHEVQEGGAAALIFSYKEDEATPADVLTEPAGVGEEKEQQEVKEDTAPIHQQQAIAHETTHEIEEREELAPTPEPMRAPDLSVQRRHKTPFSHRQKLFLTIAIVLLIVLASTVYLSMKKMRDDKAAALFQGVFAPAQQKYDEGQGLLTLNQSLARDDFKQAKDMLEGAKSKFPADSQEEKQITDLLAKVDKGLSDTAQINTVEAKKVDSSTDAFLAFASKNTGKVLTQDDTSFYMGSDTAISQVNKKTAKSTDIIKNKTDWKTMAGLGTYLGNFYIADSSDGVLKYVPAGGSFSKSAYFADGVKPDLSKATSLAIDGSIWILTTDGQILKFTKGKADSFSISGLDNKFSSPTRIVTSVDDDNIYILDNGNTRIVVIKKDGTYVAQYGANILKNTTEMTVSEKNKKVLVLSSSDIYQIDLK